MAKVRKPRRKSDSYFDAQDRLIRLNNIYRTEAFGSDRASNVARQIHRDIDDVATPEPLAEIEDAELSDAERREAIARERMRREGRA
jgi:hypothetical protein